MATKIEETETEVRLPAWEHCADLLEKRGMLTFEYQIPMDFIEKCFGNDYETEAFGHQMASLNNWVEGVHGYHLSAAGMRKKFYLVEGLDEGPKFTEMLERRGVYSIARASRFNQAQLRVHGSRMTEAEKSKRRQKQAQLDFKLGMLGNAELIHKVLSKSDRKKVIDTANKLKQLPLPPPPPVDPDFDE